MTAEILIKFARKGIILSPEAYDLIKNSKNPINLSSEIIVKLKSGNYSNEMVPVDVNTIKNMEGLNLEMQELSDITSGPAKQSQPIEKKPLETKPPEIKTQTQAKEEKPIATETSAQKPEPETIETAKTPEKEQPRVNPGYGSEHVVKIEDSEVSKDVEIKYKRNLTESKVNFDKFKVLKDTSNKSYTINEITENQTDLNLIVMITDIRSTKNGHYLIEVEDDTGSMPILVSKDNDDLIRAARNLMRDEVIGVIAQKRAGPSENRLAICQNLIDPDVPRKERKEVDFGTVFTSDIHIGSSTFLEDAFVRFTRWLNGDYGNEEQREMANNVKYMIIGGDIVDGIGVYPNQDKELAIKDITAQYDEAARLVGDIRSDIKIIITPGNHDASRVAEPQPAVPEKYAKSLYKLNNVEFLSNPSTVSLDGLEVLIYHGRGIDDMVMGSNDFSHERNDLVMKEFLRKRHLAPLYGERTPLASELEDHLVIDSVPDVLHTGHVHINTYANYKGIHCINSGTFQTQTEFQKIYNIVPTPAEVPIIDVGGNYKQLKFID